MTAPIILLELDDRSVWAFRTVAEASAWPEAVDVENGEYVAWDSQGIRLTMAVLDGRVVLEEERNGVSEGAELEAALRSHLTRGGSPLFPPNAPVEVLIDLALTDCDAERQRT